MILCTATLNHVTLITLKTLECEQKFATAEPLKETLPRLLGSEAVAGRCSVKRVFLEISQNSEENTCVRISFLIKLQA